MSLDNSSSSEHPPVSQPQSKTRKPYLLAGAGPLTATVWKTGVRLSAGSYQFNVVRTSHRNGRVSQTFSAADLRSLAKLVRVLAMTLLDDGCLSPGLRADLAHLATQLSDPEGTPPSTRRPR